MVPLKIATIGGGSGQFALLTALRQIDDIEITSIVSMVDSGGSTGRLRDELGTLPPGDILKCLLALSADLENTRKFLQKRFGVEGRLRGHSVGNMLLTFLSHYSGSFPQGVEAMAEALDVRGKVLPVTVDRATLVAELTDGSRIFGEAAIDVPRGNQREKIARTYLVPHHSDSIEVYPPVLDAIASADLVVMGPGDLFTSVIPNFNVPGVAEALNKTRAQLVYNLNIMTKFGETHEFDAGTFVAELEGHLHRRLDRVVVNNVSPGAALLSRYEEQKSSLVALGSLAEDQDRLMAYDLLDEVGEVIRHHPDKLAAAYRDVIGKLCS